MVPPQYLRKCSRGLFSVGKKEKKTNGKKKVTKLFFACRGHIWNCKHAISDVIWLSVKRKRTETEMRKKKKYQHLCHST